MKLFYYQSAWQRGRMETANNGAANPFAGDERKTRNWKLLLRRQFRLFRRRRKWQWRRLVITMRLHCHELFILFINFPTRHILFSIYYALLPLVRGWPLNYQRTKSPHIEWGMKNRSLLSRGALVNKYLLRPHVVCWGLFTLKWGTWH